MRSERFNFPNAKGEQLAATLDLPLGKPMAYALFAHCFTCGKDSLAAKDQALLTKDRALKEAEAALEQITREKEMVRQRIDKILNRLKILDLGEAT